jgi:hypothetical protein
MSEKRFYWIKLKTNFFSLDEIDFLLSQKNGCEYVVLYQMLCLKTANTNGTLEKRIGEMIVPYDIDKIVRDTKYFDYDTVVVALELYKKLGLIYEDKNSCLTIANFSEMVGSETTSAKRVREWRKKKEEQKALQCNNNVIDGVTQEYRDKSIEYRDIENKEKNKEKDIIVQNDLENRIEPSIIQLTLNDKTLYDVTQNDFNEYEELYPNVDVMQELRKMKGWLNANPTKRKTKRGIKRFINNWLSREQDKPKPNNVRKEPTPKWLDKEKNEDESKPEFSTKELIKIYDVQVKCGQTDLAEQTNNKFKELTDWGSIEEYKKAKEELRQLTEQLHD